MRHGGVPRRCVVTTRRSAEASVRVGAFGSSHAACGGMAVALHERVRLGTGTLLSHRRFDLVPLARRLAIIVVIFVAIVVGLLVAVNAEMAIMAGVRAYVEGESYWSKNQKDAVFHLRNYAASRDANDFALYRVAIAAEYPCKFFDRC